MNIQKIVSINNFIISRKNMDIANIKYFEVLPKTMDTVLFSNLLL